VSGSLGAGAVVKSRASRNRDRVGVKSGQSRGIPAVRNGIEVENLGGHANKVWQWETELRRQASEPGAVQRRGGEGRWWERLQYLGLTGKLRREREVSARAWRTRRQRFTLKRSPHAFGPHQDTFERVSWGGRRTATPVTRGKQTGLNRVRLRRGTLAHRVRIGRRRPERQWSWTWAVRVV
jgi:hypothetical protein